MFLLISGVNASCRWAIRSASELTASWMNILNIWMNIGQALGSPLKLGTFIRGGFTPERLVEAYAVLIFVSKRRLCRLHIVHQKWTLALLMDLASVHKSGSCQYQGWTSVQSDYMEMDLMWKSAPPLSWTRLYYTAESWSAGRTCVVE